MNLPAPELAGADPAPHVQPRGGGGAAKTGPWLFWGSLGWLLVTAIAWMAAQICAFLVFMLPHLSANPGGRIDAEMLLSDAKIVSGLTIASMPFALAVIVVAVRLRRWNFNEYCALHGFTWKQFAVGAAAIGATIAAATWLGGLAGEVVEPDFMDDMMMSLRQGHAVWLMFFSAVVVAPIGEEVIFRGFLHRGLAASPLGVVGAIIFTSVFWSIAHAQYNLFFVGLIFVLGLILGALRAWSGSTWLVIALHSAVSALAFVPALFPVEAA